VEFPPKLLAHVKAIQQNPPPDLDEKTRKNLNRLTVYAIDDKYTKEVDDGISAEPMPNGRIRVWIHVADATRWVQLGTPLEEEARLRTSSAYLPTEVISMFPMELSQWKLSLLEQQPSCAISVMAVLGPEGQIEEYWIGPSTVTVAKRLTEHQATQLLIKSPDEHPGLGLLLEAGERRARLREKNGAITISLPEVTVDVLFHKSMPGAAYAGGEKESGGDDDTDDGDARAAAVAMEAALQEEPHGESKGARSANLARAVGAASIKNLQLRSHDSRSPVRSLVAEMMILSGELVAGYGTTNNLALPFRSQDAPMLPGPAVLNKIPDGVCRQIAIRSVMTRSKMATEPSRHASLALDSYVQFSSPIRRYTDLLAHYQVKAHLRGAPPPLTKEEMEARLKESIETTQTVNQVQRNSEKFWHIYYYSVQDAAVRFPATVVKWVKQDAGQAMVLLEDTRMEHKLKLDKGTKLGAVLSLRVQEADPHREVLSFAIDAAKK